MLKKVILFLVIILLLTISVLSCSSDSNPGEPAPASFITLTSPVGGEIWMPDSIETITWDDNIDEFVKIDLYKDSVLNMIIADSIESSGIYEWTIPGSMPEGNGYQIRITSVDDLELYDESSDDFKITSLFSVNIIEPNGGEIWNVGGQRTIKWSANSKGSVKLELYKNNIYYETIKDSAENTGIYAWTIPSNTPLAEDYQIMITSINDGSVNDMSNEFFTTSVPLVYLYETSSTITNSEYKVQWYGNSNDSTNLDYYYCITTDTAMTNSEAEVSLAGLWDNTENNYAEVSFPMMPLNSTELFMDSTTYIDTVEAIEVTRKVVFSKFFIYGIDAFGAVSEVKSKVFGRMNQRPKFPMVTSSEFDINGFDEYWFTIGSDSAAMVLPNATYFWDPIGFRWMSDDPDGPEVDLEFKWELWALDGSGADIEIISQSYDWSVNNISISFSDVLYNYAAEGKYSFRVWVRDDALEEAEKHATVNFEVYSPQLDHGILYLDDTDDNKFTSTSYAKRTGNPDGIEVNAMYEQFLVDVGYQSNAADPLLDYDVIEFIVPLPGELYQPSLKLLSKYRLVIIATEDRTKSSGIDYSKYKDQLSDYMNIGGKVMVIGHSAILLNDLYINNYEEPVTDVFDNPASLMNFDMLSFFYDYFGIYSYSTGESKTFFSQVLYETTNTTLHNLLPNDYYYTDNYDFIGATKYDHISDAGIDRIKVDSVQVNKFWKNFAGPVSSLWEFALKENGTVLTGIPVFEAYKGEIVLKYQSVYDLPFEAGSDTTTVDVDIIHDLKWRNPGSADSTNLNGSVYRKSGTIATRYQADNDQFRTAFIGFPLVFMDNSAGKVSDMFSAMVDWFDLENDPADNWKKK